MNKNKVLEIIKDLPTEFELDELLKKLIFIEKVDIGLIQAEQGKTIPHESIKQLVKKW